MSLILLVVKMAIKISRIHARIMSKLSPKPPTVDEFVAATPAAGIRDGDPKGKPMKRVAFMSRSAVQRHAFGYDDVLISISDSGIEPPGLSHQPKEVLALAFHDHVSDSEVKELGWRKMNHADAKTVVEFVLKHENSPNIVVHCNVGESRSKAVALAIAEFTERVVFHMSDRGRITQHERTQYDFFNRRVYELILMEHMRLDC